MDFKQMYNQEVLEPNIYFKFVCFYNAKTELHDRTLTDMRSPHDNTEAYIVGENRAKKANYSEQGWIDIFNYLKNKNDEIIIDMEKSWEEVNAGT